MEVWAQLQQQGGGERLLVCYDELWPQYLAPPIGKAAFACAFVLSSESEQSMGAMTIPQVLQNNKQDLQPEWLKLTESAPAAAAIPLLLALQNKMLGPVPLNIKTPIWTTQFVA